MEQSQNPRWSTAVAAIVLSLPSGLEAEQSVPCPSDSAQSITRIEIENNDIFDESDPQTRRIHRLANALHINTRDQVIRDRLPQSLTKNANADTIREAERIIRALPYLYEATVELECKPDSATLKVATWDRWTLLPNLFFSRAGGKTNSTIGLSEDNFLGLGVYAGISYTDNTQRTGVKFDWRAPIGAVQHASFSGAIADNDDGHLFRLAFNKPFYELDGRRSYIAAAHDEERQDRQFQNGFTSNTYEHDIEFASLGIGWSAGLQSNQTVRYMVGATVDRHRFAPSPSRFTQAVPLNREFAYPWLSVEYIQNRYAKLSNVNLISHLEDIHLGWRHWISAGIETNDVRRGNDVGGHISWASSKAWLAEPHVLRISWQGNGSFGTEQDDYHQVSGQFENLIRLSDRLTLYNRTAYAQVNNNFIDRPLTLGGVSGVRGYPFQYQHGDKRWLNNFELRFYPGKSYYQMFNVAWLAFVDAGRARGDGLFFNERSGSLTSAGLGMRIYAPRFSGRNVIHINAVHPMSSGSEVPDWEFQIQVRRTF